ncbi:hypothetical protein [Aciduliprofundum sp. MAR08-339]
MSRIIKSKVKFISLYLEEEYLAEIMRIRIKKFIRELREFEEEQNKR